MFLILGSQFRYSSKAQRWSGVCSRILDLERELETLSDSELRKASLALRHRAQSGELLSRLLPEGFALVRQAASRTLGMRHYEVQLIGGQALFEQMIAVMQTGEGKTLTATLPLYLEALAGKGAHLATANDYLAERDGKEMRPLFEALGLTVGIVTAASTQPDRIAAYAADITYSTAKEIGFDFLRDRLHKRSEEEGGGDLLEAMMRAKRTTKDSTVQRDLNFVIVDEADSILIDEAKTPLIISSIPDDSEGVRAALYRWAAEHAKEFQQELDYKYDTQKRNVKLSDQGRLKVRRLKKPATLERVNMLDLYSQTELALFVEHEFVRDRHYIIHKGEIVIVDEFTGRLAEGRKWRSGLHQAVEAREGVEVTFETKEAARITIQDLFTLYGKLGGMTGTMANSAAEIRKIYKVGTTHIQTNKPPQRTKLPDRVFGSEAAKWQAIVADICERNKTGRPVLVGTRSIDKSELLSKLLHERGVQHEVLNACLLPREAQIIAQAGQSHRVTVATNMAGRGTDIKLSEHARSLGGLHVICTEVHESARIDRQLVGRCGRQGDPGSFQFYMSLEDEILVQAFGPKRASRLRRTNPNDEIDGMAALFFRAQRKIERRHFQSRKALLFQERRRHLAQREMGQDPYVDTIG
ncbi:MAG TPA: helicase-related protein [Pirellulaceae bacterium]|nr:helicase-related protein [Pirellulaceae bacterium]HMO91893.1 helicase-related protein [Pirellulaceae bacterium]HMP68693.1 helicase-related protein [Pirellulaceae bacterium]